MRIEPPPLPQRIICITYEEIPFIGLLIFGGGAIALNFLEMFEYIECTTAYKHFTEEERNMTNTTCNLISDFDDFSTTQMIFAMTSGSKVLSIALQVCTYDVLATSLVIK